MNKLDKTLVPAVSTICFVIISVLAISFKAYESEGVFPLISDVLFSSPICYFWMLWIALIYFSVNGIYKEYYAVLSIWLHQENRS